MRTPSLFALDLKTEADPSLTTPKLKKTLGAPCAQDDSRAGLREGMRSCELCRDGAFRQHLLDAADGPSCAFFVFCQAEADVGVAVVAEAYAGADGHFGFVEEQL